MKPTFYVEKLVTKQPDSKRKSSAFPPPKKTKKVKPSPPAHPAVPDADPRGDEERKAQTTEVSAPASGDGQKEGRPDYPSQQGGSGPATTTAESAPVAAAIADGQGAAQAGTVGKGEDVRRAVEAREQPRGEESEQKKERPPLSEERLAKLAKARERAAEVRAQKAEQRRKDAEEGARIIRERQEQMDKVKKELDKRDAQKSNKRAVEYAPPGPPRVLPVPSGPAFVTDPDSEEARKVVDSVLSKYVVPTVTHDPSLVKMEADREEQERRRAREAIEEREYERWKRMKAKEEEEEAKRIEVERDRAALDVYRKRIRENTRQLLMNAVFGC